jgi:hypothetical protein
MGFFIKPSSDKKSAGLFTGPGINGKKFDGDKLKNANNERSYAHLEGKRVGKDFVFGPGSLKRAPGTPRGRDVKKGSK